LPQPTEFEDLTKCHAIKVKVTEAEKTAAVLPAIRKNAMTCNSAALTYV
jgi:hypothetical protein